MTPVVLLLALLVPSLEPGTLHLCVRPGEPAETEVLVRVQPDDGEPWHLRLASEEWQKPITLPLERGACEIVVEAPQFAPYRTRVEVAERPVDVVAELRPLRTITGIVVERASGVAVANANVTAQNGAATVTGRDGKFALQLDPEQWPSELAVSAGGFGSRHVAVPKARANAALAPIELARGATVVAGLHQTTAGQVTAVELVRLQNDGRRPGGVVQRQVLPASSSRDRTIRFEDVEPGPYVVLARGAHPCERAGQRIDIRTPHDAPIDIHITPYTLRLRTLRDHEPFGGARVLLRHHDAFWESAVDLPPAGETSVPLWQTGRFSATVESPENVPYRLRRTIEAPGDVDWPLEMPRLEVTGQVVDADTRAPVPHAAVALEMTSPERHHLTVSTKAGSDGRFRFAPVLAGEHTIRAAAADYPPSEVGYAFAADEESRAVTVALQRTPVTRLSVVDARARPLPGVDVFVFRGDARVLRSRTDAAGRLPVFVPKDETREVFAIPRDGSLGVIRIASGAPEASLVIRDPVSSIVARANLPAVALELRYEGFPLPFEVLQALTGRGARTIADANGRIVLEHMPPGVYDLRAVSRAGTGDWTSLVAVPGENAVVLEPTR